MGYAGNQHGFALETTPLNTLNLLSKEEIRYPEIAGKNSNSCVAKVNSMDKIQKSKEVLNKEVDALDLKIMSILQGDARLSVRKIATELGRPISTVHSKIRQLEKAGFIRGYTALLNGKKLGITTTAFVLVSFSYRQLGEDLLSQREVARRIAQLDEVQEVHIISGDWDLIIKVRERDVDAIGRFVVDKLRSVKGIDKTVTCIVFETAKETTSISYNILSSKIIA